MSRLTLRFRDPGIEDKFAIKNFESQIDVTRLSTAGGALVFALFGILDVYVIPDVLYEAWALRFILVCPVLLGLVALSYTKYVTPQNSGMLSFVMLVPGIAVVTMTAIAGSPGAYLYYAGIIVAVGYSNCLWRLSYIYSSIVSAITVAFYVVVVLYINPMPSNVVASNLTFLMSTIGVSMFLNYIQESQLRANFVDNEKLRAEQRRSERLLSRSEAANRAKNDFLAIMSHELRTPLNAIIGFSEVMIGERFGALGNERYREYMKDIRASGERVIAIINDLLDISRIETGKLDLAFAHQNLNELVESCVAVMQPQANRERIIIRTSLAHALPPVVADARALRQIALNLIGNSIHLANAGGQVIVSTALSDFGEVMLRVRDTGHGLNDNEVAAALEPFRTRAPSDQSEGSAVSLSLTKALVEANRAKFQIRTAGRSGTLIEIVFPHAVARA